MKKIAAVAMVALAFISKANAQKVYVQAGGNLANITKNKDGDTDGDKSLYSFNAGVMGTLGISKVVDIESGLLFTGKGQKFKSENANGDFIKSTFAPYYIELPVNVIFKVPMDKDNNFFVGAGPYGAIGVAGKSKFESKIGLLTTKSESNIQFNNDDPTTQQQEDASYAKIKRFDYGVNFTTGFALKTIIIKANYGLGLAKINSTETNNSADQKNKYRTVSLSVGIPL